MVNKHTKTLAARASTGSTCSMDIVESSRSPKSATPRPPGRDDAADVLQALYTAPFAISRPAVQSLPFVFASPHSGRLYPPGFVAHSRLNALALRRSEDAFVDELFACVTGLGAPLIAARFPRAYLDVNRAAEELDPAMFAGALTRPADPASHRVVSGLGVIPRIVRDGAEIYRDRLEPSEAVRRLDGLYHPYHAALQGLIAETRARFGYAVLIDCHSMPSAAAVPDMIVGDRYGVSAAPQLTLAAERALEMRAFTVGRNTPYAGGYTTHRYGRRAGAVQALQIEINRGLYLDEERVARGPRFADVAARLADAIAALTAADLRQLMPLPAPPTDLAAE